MSDLDQALFLLVNASAHPPHAVVLIATLIAKYLILLVPLHLALVWAAGNQRMRIIATTALAALVLALVANLAIGLVVHNPRPFVVGIGHTFLAHRANSSFPSDHATVFFTYAAVLMVFGKDGLAVLFGVLGLTVAWSRVYLGIHYPLDMVGAAVVGALAASATVWAMRRFGRAPLMASERLHGALMPLLVVTHVVARR
ncbi:MAG TPA: phosphatase PAP2 family protein [Hyphomicrobiales bacterium]|nr:phosphatase PAP2 family protein [Hyphomicrobiales bacterium]